jgi:hypothetical protein
MQDPASQTLASLSELGLVQRPESTRHVLSDLSAVATFSPQASYVWRGQDAAAWEPQAGLYRRVARSKKFPDHSGRAVILTLEAKLLADARAAGYVSGSELADFATLTHYGAATRLLDVTVIL